MSYKKDEKKKYAHKLLQNHVHSSEQVFLKPIFLLEEKQYKKCLTTTNSLLKIKRVLLIVKYEIRRNNRATPKLKFTHLSKTRRKVILKSSPYTMVRTL